MHSRGRSIIPGLSCERESHPRVASFSVAAVASWRRQFWTLELPLTYIVWGPLHLAVFCLHLIYTIQSSTTDYSVINAKKVHSVKTQTPKYTNRKAVETVSMHSEAMTPGRTKMPLTGHIRDWTAVVRQVPGSLGGRASDYNAIYLDVQYISRFTLESH